MARLAGGPSWGWRPVVTPILAFVVVVVVGQLLAHTLHPGSSAARLWASALLNGGAQLVLGVSVWWGGRQVAATHGGWSAFGWSRPRGRDVGLAAIGVLVVFAGRYVINVVLGGLTHGDAVRQAQNLHITHFSWPGAVILLVVTTIAAPVLEEFTFRGLLLRTFMRRWTFLPAAAASTAIFALFHTYEVRTVLGAVTLALVVAVLGATNCALVRYSDRLAPGIAVHAFLNGLSTAVLLVVAAR